MLRGRHHRSHHRRRRRSSSSSSSSSSNSRATQRPQSASDDRVARHAAAAAAAAAAAQEGAHGRSVTRATCLSEIASASASEIARRGVPRVPHVPAAVRRCLRQHRAAILRRRVGRRTWRVRPHRARHGSHRKAQPPRRRRSALRRRRSGVGDDDTTCRCVAVSCCTGNNLPLKNQQSGRLRSVAMESCPVVSP